MLLIHSEAQNQHMFTAIGASVLPHPPATTLPLTWDGTLRMQTLLYIYIYDLERIRVRLKLFFCFFF